MRKFVLLIAALLMLTMVAAPVAASQPTIAEIVVSSANGNPAQFTILLAAVQAADPGIIAALSNPASDLTVFAPTDAAFLKLFNALGLTPAQVLANRSLLNDTLLYHVLPARYNAASLVQRASLGYPIDYIRTLQGSFLEFTNDHGSLIVDSSTVISANINASNGIIHVIDTVLLSSFNFGESGLRSFVFERSSRMNGANEVPAGSGDPDGTGTASIQFYPSRGQACWSFSTRNIGTITLGHIHRGAAGANGPVVIDFDPVRNGNAVCVSAPAALLREIANNPAGFYVNIHTSEFRPGAVRGQLTR